MKVIIHRIRLHPDTDPARFEKWVREVDYATCPELPSVRAFSVHRISAEPDAEFHYVEIITVTGTEEFERDMRTPAFHGLETEFDTMAAVVDEIAGTRIGPGYAAV